MTSTSATSTSITEPFFADPCLCCCSIVLNRSLQFRHSLMGRTKRTRKAPLVPSERKLSSVSHKATQSTISAFHTLIKQRKRIEGQLASSASSEQHQVLQKRLQELECQVNDIGGLEAYQRASTLGQSSQRGGDSSHVLIKWLKDLRPSSSWSLPLQ